MASLYLFRLKAIEAPQGTLFDPSGSRGDFLSELIISKPSAETRQGYIWHIGNVREVELDGLEFAAGRTTTTSRDLYDEESGNFVEVEEEESPFTRVIYDKHFSLLGIVPKARLAPNVKGIAKNLEKLLNLQSSVRDAGIRIEIAEIGDPEDFIQQVREAYAVVDFTAEFGRPNPFDVNSDFHRPMEKYLEATDGAKGKTTVQGEDLDRDNVEDVSRSVASTGNEAKARLRKGRGQRPVTRHMRGDPVSVQVEEEEVDDSGGILRWLREAYQRVRRYDEE